MMTVKETRAARAKVKQEKRDGYGPDAPWVGVVALDPGKTTGIAWCRAKVAVLRDDGWMNTLKTRMALGGIDGGTGEVDCTDLVEGVARLMDAIAKIGVWNGRGVGPIQRVVVCEDFALYGGKRHVGKDALWSPRVAAALQVVMGLIDRLPDEHEPLFHAQWVWQMASEMGVVTNDRLKQWKLYVPGEHARDAQKHLIAWLRKQRWETWLRGNRSSGK